MPGNPLPKKTLWRLTGLLAGICLAIAALCLAQTSSVLRERAQAEAIDYAALAGAALAERLRAAQSALDRIAMTTETGERGPFTAGALARPYFESVTWVGESAATAQLHGTPAPGTALQPAEQRRISPDTTVLVRGTGSAALELVMARRIGGRYPGVLAAHLDRDYLWKRGAAESARRETCVLHEFEVVFCSGAPLAESVRRQLYQNRAEPSGALQWESGGDVLAGYARVNLDPAFGRLTIVALQPAADIGATAGALGRQLVPALALALLLAAVGAWLILRRARHDAGGGPIDPEAAAAPASAAPWLNAAGEAGQPGERERSAMRVLADIDRAVLSRAHLDVVIGLVLDAAPQAIGCNPVAVTVIDPDAKDQARTIVVSADSGEDRSVQVAAFDASATRSLAREPDGCVIDAHEAPAYLQPLAQRGAARLLLLPVYVDASLAALLVCGFAQGATLDGASRALARDFADRLGVALTAAAREHDLDRHVNYDPVTALPNQRLLRERLAQEIGRAQRDSREFALMYVDLDQFRKVNDSAGHLEGDAVLDQASRRMKGSLRTEDVIARFSGDEFVILLPALARGENASRVAEKLIAALSQPFVVAGTEHHLGASIGISVFPQDGRTADKLLRNANFAMYRAKTAGRGQCVFFDEGMNAEAMKRATLERDIRAAIANGELHLAWQPQVDLRDGRIIGAEALARWNHPRLGAVPPSVFIDIVERSSLIEAVGKFVREAACAQYAAWQARRLPLPRIAINVSSHEIQRGGYLERIRTLLQTHALRPYSLELEITENLLLDASEEVLAVLRGLRELGVHLAIDDFGTGYSSLAYLKKLPFDVLKIDRSFVKDLGTDDGSEGVVNAILGVARSLGKDVIAEGVETEAQRAFLAKSGCEGAQGYLWSQPLPAEQFESLVRDWTVVPRPPMPTGDTPMLAAG